MIIQIDENHNIISVIGVGGMPEGDPSYFKMNKYDVPEEILTHIYDYKYIDGEFVFDEETVAIRQAAILQKKLEVLSKACHTVITNGIDFNGEHYSLSQEDQTNLTNLSFMSQTLSYVPYHADGQLCREYSAEEIQALAAAAIRWVTFHTTYHNFLKAYARSISNKNDLLDLHYGSELPTEYMNAIIAVMGTSDISEYMVEIPDTESYDRPQRILRVDKLYWEEDLPPIPVPGPEPEPDPDPGPDVDPDPSQDPDYDGGDDDEETSEDDEPIDIEDDSDSPDDIT